MPHFPAFELQDQDGRTWTNADIAGGYAVFFFYPKDNTSGCTTEACEFRDNIELQKGAKVFGVSPDPVKSHAKFSAKHGFDFPLLADPDKALIGSLGLWVEKTLYGRKYMGVERSTFLIGPDGSITKEWRKVKPEGHAAEVLAALD